MNYASNHPNEISSYDMLVELYNELDNYSAKDLVDVIKYMKQKKKRQQNRVPYQDPMDFYEEKKALSDEMGILQDMFVCSTRYIHTSDMSDATAKTLLDRVYRFYDVYSRQLDTYSKQRFGMNASELRYKIIREEIERGQKENEPYFTDFTGFVNEIARLNFYIPYGLNSRALRIEINKRTLAFCDVLFRWYRHKRPHNYIYSREFIVISRITIICILAAYIVERNTDVWEIEDCMMDFSKLNERIQIIEQYLGIRIDVGGIDPSGKDNYYYPVLFFVKSKLLSPTEERLEIYKQTNNLRMALTELVDLKEKFLPDRDM